MFRQTCCECSVLLTSSYTRDLAQVVSVNAGAACLESLMRRHLGFGRYMDLWPCSEVESEHFEGLMGHRAVPLPEPSSVPPLVRDLQE